MQKELKKACTMKNLLILVALGWGAFVPVSYGADSNVVIVVDASGSMWGQINGEAKITGAKRVLGNVIDAWNPTDRLGLIAYGHRREGDCADIETVLPLGPFDAARAASAIASLTPLGKTPLTDAVRLAAANLDIENRSGSVILITDGLETCSGDPCALGKELAARGIDFQAHVIGFGIENEDTAALQCLAHETGGRYQDAADAGTLGVAVASALESVNAVRNVTLRGVDGEGLLLSEPVAWNIYEASEIDVVGARVGVGLAAEYAVALPPGAYVASAVFGQIFKWHQFTVETNAPLLEEVTLVVGFVTMRARLSPDREPLNMNFSWQIFPLSPHGDRHPEIARDAGHRARFGLPAGAYEVSLQAEDLVRSKTFIVHEGEESEEIVDLDAGLLTASALSSQGGPTKGHVAWKIFFNGGGSRGPEMARETRRRTTFLLPKGSYVLEGQYKGEEQSVEFELGPGSEISREIVFAAE